jgi:iron complex outermembrane receptor protein
MKNLLFYFLFIFTFSLFSQEIKQDTTRVQNLEEVIVSSIRVKQNAPIAFTNVSKDELGKKNLGQDLPILLNSLTSVVTTSDAGAGVGIYRY